ncbi:MAG: aspartate aminotransferase family protein, partial [Solirubrobacteraceae bacterium]
GAGLLAQAVAGLPTQAIPSIPGFPAPPPPGTVIVEWGDARSVTDEAERQPLAAIIVEPVPANMGVVPPPAGFLELLRELASQTGALLIFDEVITGFRVSRGGAQEYFGVMPDLTILGKIVGGGLPAAAYGGSRELMERVAPAGDVYQAGTLSGNPLAVSAALATLAELDPAAYERLSETTDALASGLRGAALSAGVSIQVQSVPGLLTPFFSERPVEHYGHAAACDLERYGAWCRALLARGVYPPASQFEAWFPSLAHSDEDIEQTVEAARAGFAEVAR